MTEKPFEVGEIVYLNSGSAPMTVTLILPGDHVRLTWMAGREVRSSRFPRLTLTRENPGFDYGANDALPDESVAATEEETIHQTSFPQEAMREALATGERSERGRKGAEARWGGTNQRSHADAVARYF